MVSALEVNQMRSRAAREMIDVDPDATTPHDIGWRPITGKKAFLAGIMRTIGTGGVTAFKIVANTAADGSGTDIEIKSHALAAVPDALEDQIWLECSMEEVAALAEAAGVRALGISAQITLVTATDEFVAFYEFDPLHKEADLTADSVA